MKKIFVSVLALTLGACNLLDRGSSDYWQNQARSYNTYPIHYYMGNEFDSSEKAMGTQEVATHTYQRNVVVSANVGQRMVDSQTFNIERYTKNVLAAQSNATISTDNDEILIKKGQEFTPFGEAIIDGHRYMLIKGNKHGAILMLDAGGYVLNRICKIYHDELMFSHDYAIINPSGLRIAPTNSTRTDVSDKKQNFEIIFNGYRNGLIEFTYIDSENQAQKFAYKQEPQNININGVRINITGIYPDRIEYMLPQ